MRALALMGLAAILGLAPSAQAGVYGDELTKCLVKSTSPSDQALMMKWMFAAMSVNPNFKGLTTITAQQRVDISKSMTNLMEKLVLTDCRSPAKDAIRYEGPSVVQAAFQTLGQVAARALFSDPATIAELQAIDANSNKDGWTTLMKEAGAPEAAAQQGK